MSANLGSDTGVVDTGLGSSSLGIGNVGNTTPERERTGEGGRTGTGVLAFATDAQTEAVLREALSGGDSDSVEVRRGELSDVERVLRRGGSPQVLIVDISGVDQPLTALGELSQLVEPNARVLAIGDREDLSLYRGLTRGLGVLEYLFKPLTREMVVNHFGPVVAPVAGGTRIGERVLRGGRVIAVTGVHGGVGATTIAANLAWVIAEVGRRHTLLLDSDLHGGPAAMLLSAKPAPGLRVALDNPDRVDDLFLARTAQRLGERLHVLASEGRLDETAAFAPDAASRLLDALRRRYNVIVCDAAWPASPVGRNLCLAAHQRILVAEPSVAGARDVLRYLAAMPAQPPALIVLNHVAGRGDIGAAQFERAIGRAPDLVVPHLKGALREAANLGEPAAAKQPRLRALMQDLALRAASVGMAGPRRRRRWR